MIGELIGDWIKGILIDGIMGNLSGLFSTVNTKVGEIASDVGTTPQAWNSGIFNMLQSLSDTVIVPIAAAILAVIMCYELIDMIVEKNNMHDFDTSMFFRWIFKCFCHSHCDEHMEYRHGRFRRHPSRRQSERRGDYRGNQH